MRGRGRLSSDPGPAYVENTKVDKHKTTFTPRVASVEKCDRSGQWQCFETTRRHLCTEYSTTRSLSNRGSPRSVWSQHVKSAFHNVQNIYSFVTYYIACSEKSCSLARLDRTTVRTAIMHCCFETRERAVTQTLTSVVNERGGALRATERNSHKRASADPVGHVPVGHVHQQHVPQCLPPVLQ